MWFTYNINEVLNILKMEASKMDEEKQELSHDPVPGYMPVFLVVFTLSVIYLAVVFYCTL
jgi:hypothetical protein